jgi:hypothetical protein
LNKSVTAEVKYVRNVGTYTIIDKLKNGHSPSELAVFRLQEQNAYYKSLNIILAEEEVRTDKGGGRGSRGRYEDRAWDSLNHTYEKKKEEKEQSCRESFFSVFPQFHLTLM